jgi:DNA mismatch endonuclease, patch repair protein
VTDTLSRQQRSENMARIRSKDTQPELRVRSLLHGLGFRFRLHSKQLPGSPDIILPKYNAVIFVHGCLWHGHSKCRRGRRPMSNVDYWNRKITRNLERDATNAELLRRLGWKRIVIWECELKDSNQIVNRLTSLLKQ